MLYIDLKYLHFLQNKLEGFVQKKDNVFNFRCPRCGDSRKDKNKKRAFIYSWKNILRFSCHNCGESHTFGNFLSLTDPNLYEQYRVELFKEKYGSNRSTPKKEEVVAAPKSNTEEKLAKLKTLESIFHSICTPLSSLPDDNPAVAYCLSRKIPRSTFSRLYYIDDTMKLLEISPDLNVKFSEKRLVLPFFDKCGNLIGMTCRALGSSKLRYLTVKLTDHVQVFGMDRVDPTKKLYVVEGPIDSLFLPNAIAVTGTSFGKVDSVLRDLNIAPDQAVIIIDNQPRNKEVVKIHSRLIDAGYTSVVWDIDDSLGKDINALVQNSTLSLIDVYKIIKRCTTRGLEARMKFIQWKKC